MVTQPGSRLEQHMGKQHNAAREDQFKEDLMNCPPVDPRLMAHLKTCMFTDIGAASPKHPQLGQMLLVQHGVNKVLDYLTARHAQQSEQIRKELAR